MGDAVWFRAVCESPLWKASGGVNPHTSPAYLNRSQCRSDVLRKVDGEEWVVMPEHDIPDDPTEVFDE